MAQTYTDELLRSARTLARLQTQRRKLRRQLRQVELDIKAERKTLNAIVNRNTDPDLVPSRVFGAGVGHKWNQAAPAEPREVSGPAQATVDALLKAIEPDTDGYPGAVSIEEDDPKYSPELPTKVTKREKHLASCQKIEGRWFCAADCPHHVVVDVDAEKAAK